MNLQKRRLDSGWSQEDLALHSGLSVRTIQRLENGQKASLESLKCLAAVFETSVTTLVQEQSMTVIETVNPANIDITQQKEKDAIAYVKNLRAFHMNWMTFIVIMPLLFVLNLVLSPGFLWAAIVGFCWGFGIALNALVVFRLFSLFSGEWEQNEFQRRLGIGNE